MTWEALLATLVLWVLVALVVIVSFTWSMHVIIKNNRHRLGLWIVGCVTSLTMCVAGTCYGLDHCVQHIESDGHS